MLFEVPSYVLMVSISGRIQFYSVEHDDPGAASSDVPSSIAMDHDRQSLLLFAVSENG